MSRLAYNFAHDELGISLMKSVNFSVEYLARVVFVSIESFKLTYIIYMMN